MPRFNHSHDGKSATSDVRSASSGGGAFRGVWRGVGIALLVIGALAVVLQVVGSPIARRMVNAKLAAMPEFAGRTDQVKIALWRGTLEVSNLTMFERGHEQDAPLLRVQRAALKFAPSELVRGKLGGTALIDGAELDFTRREPRDPEKVKESLQEKKEQVQRWQTVLREALPITLSRLEVKNSRVNFIDPLRQPKVEVGIRNLHVVATDLQNRPKENGDTLASSVEVTGLTTGDGKLRISLRLDPVAPHPRFTLNFELKDQQLPPINRLLQAYADADVSRGTFELFSEINAEHGAYDGYVKPMFTDLDFRTASDKHKGVGSMLKGKVVGAVVSVLKNDETDQIATKAPFVGNFAENNVDIWEAISTCCETHLSKLWAAGWTGKLRVVEAQNSAASESR